MTTAPALTPVREAHRIDEPALAAYLRTHLPGFADDFALLQFEGGQSNPTYRLESGGQRWVLRKKPPGQLLPSAHQIEREYRAMAALAGSDVPVPRMDLFCDDAAVIGTPFYVMEWIDGRILPQPALPGLAPEERAALYEDAIRILAALHRIDPAAVGLEAHGRPGNYYARQISRWTKQYEASRTEDIPAMERLVEWLPANVPDSDESGIVHGDYRFGNLIVHPAEPRILAVLDWELSTLGHPLGDLAYFCQGYRGEATPGETLVGSDLAALGIPDEEAVVRRYCEWTGRPAIEDWDFYMVFVMFRSAAIVQGVYKRGLDGNASSANAREYGAIVARRAREAWEIVEAGASAKR
jgi:aminoglycoside phosphotransferase (APT) family kinase protein